MINKEQVGGFYKSMYPPRIIDVTDFIVDVQFWMQKSSGGR